MNKIHKAVTKLWKNYWASDEDDLNKLHLSQHDRRYLLLGALIICLLTYIVAEIAVTSAIHRLDQKYNQAYNQMFDSFAAYLAQLTDEEYEQVAQAVRDEFLLFDTAK